MLLSWKQTQTRAGLRWSVATWGGGAGQRGVHRGAGKWRHLLPPGSDCPWGARSGSRQPRWGLGQQLSWRLRDRVRWVPGL